MLMDDLAQVYTSIDNLSYAQKYQYTLYADNDECVMAALAGEQLCMIPMMCENTNGSFACVCPPGSELFNNDTMCREGNDVLLVKHQPCS